MTGMLRVPRTRGALSGLLLVLFGAWGALIPFIGPVFHYAYTPATAWTYTTGRLWLEILPGAAALVGGLILLASALRPAAMLGAWLGVLSGAWFALSTVLHPLWPGAVWLTAGAPASATPAMRVAEQVGFFTGLGVAILFVAATALGRLSVIGKRDVALAEAAAESAAAGAPAASYGPRDRAPADAPTASYGPRDRAPADAPTASYGPRRATPAGSDTAAPR
jgi:hypothetical protein